MFSSRSNTVRSSYNNRRYIRASIRRARVNRPQVVVAPTL